MKTELGWNDEIIVDNRITTVDQVVQRRMGQLAVAAARPFPHATFPAKLVHEFDYDEGTQGRIECWTDVDGEAELADLMDRAGFRSMRSFRRFSLTGSGFSASALQSWPVHVPHDDPDPIEDNAGHPPWTEAPDAQGDLRLLLRFLRVSWWRPVKLARSPYRARRFFETYSATGTAIEVEDGFALGRKLKLSEWKSDLEDDGEEDSLRPVSAFIDFRDAMSGDLLIEPRDSAGGTHSTLIFEFKAEAEDFLRRFTRHQLDRPRRFQFFRRLSFG